MADIQYPCEYEKYGRKCYAISDIAKNIKKTGFAYSLTESRMKKFIELTSEITNPEIALFPGCTLTTFFSRSLSNFIGQLLKLGIKVVIPNGLSCCGYPFTVVGDVDNAIKLAYRNNEVLSIYDKVLFTCPECYKVFKENEEIIDFTPILITEYLNSLLKKGEIKLASPKILKDRFLVIHDPCVSGRFIFDCHIVRDVLDKLELKYKSPETSRLETECCGFGGLQPFVDEKKAIELCKKRLNELMKLSNSIVTTCPACMLAFDRTAKLTKTKIDILHLMNIVSAGSE